MPVKKPNYADMFTLRKDGRYMGFWHELDKDGKPTGPRHDIYDRDPERLYYKIRDKETPARTTFADVLDAWEKKHRGDIKDRTWANYAPHVESIKALYGKTPVEDITAFDVQQDLLAQKAKGLSHTVVNSRRCIWRMALDHAVADPKIRLPYNPALSVKNPKGLPKGKRKTPEDDVLTVILADSNDMDFGFIPFFFLCTGLRRSEGLRRPTADIDTQSWEIRIPQAKTDAGIRTVPIIKPLRAPLLAWIEAHPGPWLFPHRYYYAGRKAKVGYMTDSNWDTAWASYCSAHGWVDEDGKPTIGLHNLRHGTATLLYEAGVDVYTAQHILGHSNVTTTLAIYTELRKKHEAKNVTKFSRKLSTMLSKSEKTAK